MELQLQHDVWAVYNSVYWVHYTWRLAIISSPHNAHGTDGILCFTRFAYLAGLSVYMNGILRARQSFNVMKGSYFNTRNSARLFKPRLLRATFPKSKLNLNTSSNVFRPGKRAFWPGKYIVVLRKPPFYWTSHCIVNQQFCRQSALRCILERSKSKNWPPAVGGPDPQTPGVTVRFRVHPKPR